MKKKLLTALAVPALMLMGAAPAQADHGNNCVLSGGGTMGQGWCPELQDTSHLGKPTVVVTPTPEPTTEPPVVTVTPPVVTPVPVVTPTPVVTLTPPNPPKVKIPPKPVAVPTTTVPRSWQTQAPKPVGCTRHAGQNFCVGQVNVQGDATVVVPLIPASDPAVVTDWSQTCDSRCLA